jgi:hypothetical protein
MNGGGDGTLVTRFFSVSSEGRGGREGEDLMMCLSIYVQIED